MLCKKLFQLCKTSCFAFATAILLVSTLYAQNVEDEMRSPMSRFNERGYAKSASFGVNGNEIITDYSGGLNLQYNMPVNLPNQLGGDVSVIYNTNTEHDVFPTVTPGQPLTQAYSVNLPEWIIGYKGIALQVLNFPVNFWAGNFGTNSGGPLAGLLKGENVPYIVPGYHYCNRIDKFNFEDDHGRIDKRDAISILMADGSKKVFINVVPFSIGPKPDTGTYVASGVEDASYALVRKNPNNSALRRMWYYPGDGLIYLFVEEKIHFNDRKLPLFEDIYTKAFYLKQIINPNKETVTFNYASRSWINPSGNYGSDTLGRKLCTGITVTGINGSQGVVNLAYSEIGFPGSETLNYIEITNSYGCDTLLLGIDRTLGAGSPWFSLAKDASESASQIKMVSAIIKNGELKDDFQYRVWYRDIEHSSNSITKFKFRTPAYTLESAKYSSGSVSHFRFWGENYLSYNYNYQGLLRYRDQNTQLMLLERKQSREIGGISQPALYENYYYTDPLVHRNELKAREDKSIITSVCSKRYDQNGNLLDTIETVKKFNKYCLLGSHLYHGDIQSVTRLMEETQTNNNEVKTLEYEYEIGGMETLDGKEYRVGSMQMNRQTEKRTLAGVSSERVTIFQPNHTAGYMFGVFKKLIKDKDISIAPDGYYTQTKYFSGNLSFDIDLETHAEAYYRNRVREKIDGTDTIRYEYNGAGQVVRQIADPESKPKITTYNYKHYLNANQFAHSQYNPAITFNNLLESVEMPNGVKIHYKYFPDTKVDSFVISPDPYYIPIHTATDSGLVLTDSIYRWNNAKYSYGIKGKMVFDNASITDTTIGLGVPVLDFTPLKTIVAPVNGDTLITEQILNAPMLPVFEKDVNCFISKYEYDNLKRPVLAVFPGSFSKETAGLGQQVHYYYKNLSLPITRTINYDEFDPSPRPNLDVIELSKHGVFGAQELDQLPVLSDDAAQSDIADSSQTELDTANTEDVTSPRLIKKIFCAFIQTPLQFSGGERVNSAKLSFFSGKKVGGGSYHDLKIGISAVTQATNTDENTVNFTTTVEVPSEFIFIDSTHFLVDVAPLISGLINSGQKLHGFKFQITTRSNYPGDTLHLACHILAHKGIIFDYYGQIAVHETIPIEGTYHISYDNAAKTVVTRSRRNNTLKSFSESIEKNSFDSFGNLRENCFIDSSGTSFIRGSFVYDGNNQKITESDAMNRSVHYQYDALGRNIRTVFGALSEASDNITYAYYPVPDDGKKQFEGKKVTDELGRETETIFNSTGQAIETRALDPAQAEQPLITKTDYTWFRKPEKVTSPEGKEILFDYDKDHNMIRRTSPDDGVNRYWYDKFGKLRFSMHKNEDGSPVLVFTGYDSYGRMLYKGTKNDCNFDDYEMLLDPDTLYNVSINGIPSFEGQADTSLLLQVNQYDNFTVDGIFPFGNSVLIPSNERIYRGKLTATAFRDKPRDPWNYKFYGYDALGNVKSLCVKYHDLSYQRIANSYDNLGTLTNRVLLPDKPDLYYWYGYDEQGRLAQCLSSMHSNSTTARADALYNYNNAGQETWSLVGGNINTTKNYDAKGRLQGISATQLGSTLFDQKLGYYGNNNISSSILRRDGTLGWDEFTDTYGYDYLNRLVTVNRNSLPLESYSYSPDGSILAKNTVKRSSSVEQRYSYMPENHRLSAFDKRVTYEDGQTDIVDGALTYDGRGNVTGNSLSNLQDIVYDTRNLPLQMVTGITADTVYYSYDDAGHRTRKEVNREKIWYLYDPAGRELGKFKMVPEIGAIKLKSYNLHGNGGNIGRVDVNYTRTGPFINEGDTTYGYTRNDAANYYIKDHLGSVRATMQRASTIFAEDTYPFGASQQRYEDGGTAPQRFDFTGKERDRESGLHYFGARNYDSDLGIWYGVDPLADKYPGLSPYNYCINNPVNSVDPDGMAVEKPLDTILDIAFIAFDVGKLAYDKVTTGKTNREDWAALGADVVCALTPVATGGGMAVRGASKADDAVDAVRTVANKRTDKLREAAATGQEAHRQLEKDLAKQGARIEKNIDLSNGVTVRKDAVRPDGTVVIIKPDTKSGKQSARTREKLMNKNGYKTETILYSPKDKKFQPGSDSYIGPKKENE